MTWLLVGLAFAAGAIIAAALAFLLTVGAVFVVLFEACKRRIGE